MNAKKIIKLSVVFWAIIVIAGVVSLFNAGRSNKSGPANDASGLIISDNAIYISEQMPGNSVSVQIVRLKNPGFVAVYEDFENKPGKILGVSGLIEAGEKENLPPIILSRPTKDKETIYAILYLDDGNGRFDIANDKQIIDPIGKVPMMMVVTVSKDAVDTGIISP